MTKSRKPNVSQAQKDGLKILKQKGLWKPEKPRAAPTKYALSLLRKYAPVIKGEASVVTVPKDKSNKGFKEARSQADNKVGVFAVRNKLVIPKAEGEKVSYSRKRHTYRVTQTSRDGTTKYIREPLGRKISSPDEIQLKPNQRVSVPFNRPGRGIEWMDLTEDDFRATWNQYKDKYQTIGDNLSILTIEQSDFDEDFDSDDAEQSIFEREPNRVTPAPSRAKKKTKRNTKKV